MTTDYDEIRLVILATASTTQAKEQIIEAIVSSRRATHTFQTLLMNMCPVAISNFGKIKLIM